MGNSRKQIQKAGDGSLNIQAEQITVSKGLSYEDIKAIALDVFKSNFYQLSGIAKQTARERAEEITNKFLDELRSRNPDGFQNAEDPDFQYALFTAQKEYAKTGDEELGDILIDILVDRTKEPKRGLLQIVLNESLETVPKLTKRQLDALSVLFSLKYTRYLRMTTPDSLEHYLDYRISPFVPALTKNASCYQHLEYSGCGSIDIGSINIERIFLNTYPGMFIKGFPQSMMEEIVAEYPSGRQMLIPCLRNQLLYQVDGIDDSTIRELAKRNKLEDTTTERLIQLQKDHLMNEGEVKEQLASAHNCMARLFDVWDNSYMKNMRLTSVGIAIGHANTRRITGETDNLAIWISEEP